MESIDVGAEPHGSVTHRSPARSLAISAVVVVMLAAIGVVVYSAVDTSGARVAANTSTQGFLAAGSVVISRPDQPTSLFFDADGLYPGAEVSGCVDFRYDGSADAAMRISAQSEGGSGLDRFVEFRLVAMAGTTCAEAGLAPDDVEAREIYDGRLDAFWNRHRDYATGVDLGPPMSQGEHVAVAATVVVVDDNRAGGLDTELSFTVEARPS